MKKVGFVTYNSLPNFQSGWTHNQEKSRSALVVQDTNGRGSLEEGRRTRSADEIREEITKLWAILDQTIPELDHLVVYIGSSGSERAIELAKKMPAEKLTFVGCDCGISRKEAMIQSAGLGAAKRFLCDCGGHREMESMIRFYLQSGTIGG